MDVSITGPKIYFTLPVFGGIDITETIVNSFIVIIIVAVLCKILTHKLEKVPRKTTQKIAELAVNAIDNLVVSTMGKGNIGFAPYILTLFCASVFGSLISLVGLRSVTADINTTMTWALMTFFLVHGFGVKKKGLSYFKGFAEPIPFLLPLNLISEVATPISLTFRHFGNIVSGMIISSLVYAGLSSLTLSIFNIGIPFLQIGIPAVLSVYFDLFSGCMQAFIFCMLTMVFVSNAAATD